MHRQILHRGAVVIALAVLVLSVSAGPGFTVTTPEPDPPPSAPAPGDKKEGKFREDYRRAHELIQKGEYAAGLAALRALGRDDHPDVANYIGFASRKLGRYDEAKVWYERALAADPTHVRTWQYYGVWHLEQGNRLKAEDHLQQIKLICGTTCSEFKDLKEALDGKITY
jgi:tetratricopeptide (TPR) repeat protein